FARTIFRPACACANYFFFPPDFFVTRFPLAFFAAFFTFFPPTPFAAAFFTAFTAVFFFPFADFVAFLPFFAAFPVLTAVSLLLHALLPLVRMLPLQPPRLRLRIRLIPPRITIHHLHHPLHFRRHPQLLPPIHLRRIPPQQLQVIKIPALFIKNVYHHVHAIQ